jgi:AcrR family transcriptional regulator
MPKIVNHEERRKELLTATWRVIARTGIVGATTREIAREAGVSTGVLAHYFADKEAILAAALRMAHQQFNARVLERTQGLLGLEAVRVIMVEAMPLDDERLLEAQIELNFIAVSLGNAGLREMRQEEVDRFWESLHYRTAEAQKIGQVDPAADVSAITDELVIFIAGVSQQAVLHSHLAIPERQLQVLDTVLARITVPDPAATA